MPPRPAGICRICNRNVAALTFEHVPPRAAFNNEQTRVYGLDDWLRRDEDGVLPGGRLERRGAGDYTLCADCNNKTGSWYGTELRRAAKSAIRILRQLPLDELDANVEPTWASVAFRQGATRPHPLRLIKQMLAMVLATSPPELSAAHPELAAFVLRPGGDGASRPLPVLPRALRRSARALNWGGPARRHRHRSRRHPGRGRVPTVRVRDDDRLSRSRSD